MILCVFLSFNVFDVCANSTLNCNQESVYVRESRLRLVPMVFDFVYWRDSIFTYSVGGVSLTLLYFTFKNPFYYNPNSSGYCCVASFLAAGYLYIKGCKERERVYFNWLNFEPTEN